MNASIVSDFLSGQFTGDQYAGLAIIAAIFAFGIWLHVRDTRDESRGK